MAFDKDFFRGGATASNQFDGGTGLSTADCMTNGAHKVPRQVTFRMVDDPEIYYPSHIASDFYHH